MKAHPIADVDRGKDEEGRGRRDCDRKVIAAAIGILARNGADSSAAPTI